MLAGHPSYEVTGGTVTFEGRTCWSMEPEERAQAGVFLAFQYPVEIPGVTNAYFLRAPTTRCAWRAGQEELDADGLPRPARREAQAASRWTRR
ncbi:MAG: hypothetical protein U5K74_01165 [Gemmatimonadaceae bacterium]|nr:hypothetical protein [Gemmatimonadaceae bacterium]